MTRLPDQPSFPVPSRLAPTPSDPRPVDPWRGACRARCPGPVLPYGVGVTTFSVTLHTTIMTGVRWYAITGRINGTTWDALRSASSLRDSTTGLDVASCGPDQVDLDELTRYAIGTTAQPTLGGFSCLPIIGPEGHPPLDPPGQASLTATERRVGEPEDSERLAPANQAEKWYVALSCNVHPRVWGLEPTQDASNSNAQGTVFLPLIPAGRINGTRTAGFARESDRNLNAPQLT